MSAPEKIYMSEHTASREGFKKKYAKDDLEYIRFDLHEQALTDCKRHEEAVEYLLKVVQTAYRKHHLDDYSIGWDELSEMMLNVLCNTMGDKEFNEWLNETTKETRNEAIAHNEEERPLYICTDTCPESYWKGRWGLQCIIGKKPGPNCPCYRKEAL